MLKFAKAHEEQLKKYFMNTILDKKYQFVQIGYHAIPEISGDDWNRIQRVSILQAGNTSYLLGYFCAFINRTNNMVDQLTIMSFLPEDKYVHLGRVFAKDLLTFLINLLTTFRKVRFSCCPENPIVRRYRNLVSKQGIGRAVGTYEKELFIRGSYYDEECFEILSSPNVIQKLENLLKRLEKGNDK